MITFVDYLVNFLKPYKDEPFFTSCVMKAMEKLGHITTKEERRLDPARFKACSIECDE